MRKIKIDHQYIAYLLLEMLYKEGKVNKDTYDAVMAEKERYLRMVKAAKIIRQNIGYRNLLRFLMSLI